MKRHILIGAALVFTAGQLSPSAAQPASTPDPVEDSVDSLDQLRDRLEAAQNRVTSIQERATTVEAQIASVDRQIAGVRAALDISNRLVTETGARLALIRLEIDDKKRRFRIVEGQARAIAVALYKSGPIDELEIILASRDLGDMSATFRYTEAAADNRRDVMSSLEGLQRELAVDEATYQRQLTEALIARSEKQALDQQLQELRGARVARLTDLRQEIAEERREADALAQESARIERRLAGAFGYDDSIVVGNPSALGFIWPIRGAITSGFGMRWGRMHQGLDIDGETGDPIRAAKSGTATVLNNAGGYGNLVQIDHGNGVATFYAHTSQIFVTNGQRVPQGSVIAAVGSTGFSTGSHLHFEVRVNGTPQNPLPYLP